jgi:NADPH:quinone reductase-like Zn-dependent oxidoreductase
MRDRIARLMVYCCIDRFLELRASHGRADQAVATDDDTAIANPPPLDAVTDTVGGRTAEKLTAKVKPGGLFARFSGHPGTPGGMLVLKVVPMFSKFDRKALQFMAEAGEMAS